MGSEVLNEMFDVNIQVFEMESSYFEIEGNNHNQMFYALDADWNDSTEISEEAEEQIQIQYHNKLREDNMMSINV